MKKYMILFLMVITSIFSEIQENNGLYDALIKNDIKDVEISIEKGADINKVKNGFAPIMFTLVNEKKEILKLLIKKGADLDIRTPRGDTALITAISLSQNEIVKILIDSGANLEHRNNDGLNAFVYGVLFNNKKVIELLLEKGANLESTDNDGMTTLMAAVGLQRKEMVELLILEGANLEAKDKDGVTA